LTAAIQFDPVTVGPADDLAEARHSLMVLLARLDAALSRTPSRMRTLETAAELRALQERAISVLGRDRAYEILEVIAAARQRVMTVFGTAAWDGSRRD
jgi:hypothetical protein